jgi:hypothetical protein
MAYPGPREDRTKRMPPWSSVKRDLAFGVAAVGVLASASAVLNLLSATASLPLSARLGNVLQWYRELFFPIVENTIGLVPRVFGLHLLPWAKDLVVIYFIFGSAFARSSQSYHRRAGAVRIWPIVLAALTWPLALFIVVYDSVWEKDEKERVWTRQIAKNVALQLAYVISVVLIAMVLNAADILV